ncbi:malonate--CoA ligase ACSF3, mitochondrial-like isoform X2 [Acropora muricata]|uniref:malonate--CoA ligase ACSF3, mitochondrial-like isoform X2 n=1 Tax=Acropora muricata TaxID=159855 RepID=UPI0034E4C869
MAAVLNRLRYIQRNNHLSLHFRDALIPSIHARGIVLSIPVWTSGKALNSTVFLRARAFRERVAIVDSNGTYSYASLLKLSQSIGKSILQRTFRKDLEGCCVTFLCPNDVLYVATLWAIWRNGGIAVPLCNSHPVNMYEYTIKDCDASILVSSSEFASKLEPIAKEDEVDIMFLTDTTEDETSDDLTLLEQEGELNFDERDAMIIYTSGTTGKPKGVLVTHGNLSKLIQHHKAANLTDQEKNEIKAKCQQLRLMVSGSAALPEPIMKEWQDITGHTLLERYGMTEIGMALSNPLNGPRMPGCVGTPLPGTEVRLIDSKNEVIVQGNESESCLSPGQDGKEGELQVRGPSVFKCYWNKPEATAESFTVDSWFKTGDTAMYQDGIFRILGRTSVDIIKSGGHKISALEVERHLLTHNDIMDCAVVGKPDPVWGEVVAAIITVSPGQKMCLSDLKTWASGRMIPYHIPTILLVVDELPRNAMGKVNKKELLAAYFSEDRGANV